MRAASSRFSRIVPFAALAFATASATLSSFAGPVNTDVALTPPMGGSILRLQYTYSEAGARDNIRHVNASALRATYIYGLRQDLALFVTLPYENQQTDESLPRLGRVEEAHDGIGDVTLLAKYRFWQNDARPRETLRWALVGGLDTRSGDSNFSSDSYDPILGTVFTWQRDRGWLDADLVYQFNTGAVEFRRDALRYDLSYSHRVAPVAFEPGNAWELDAVAELNGLYATDGSHELFLSPGLQYITERWILEASVQLPIIQDVNGPGSDYRFVVGLRFQW